ncbi:hypothetical protein MUK70_10295 [Dyadobacter chenwenxiniae]|uniref:Lipoprotein n=1 Tax=Dyadobacter chenwenxiniae TaxID=2906456 RepID=A0A9X1PMX4_9BACT|nr:hypothetical protein [Dyadobacter chenwenxiniae]MCF0063244.1 hypothetical protein [Dyadobacter chenwenxiniae]UON85375.1 hypothetical protein MUK70_10295 [Dyadobacter chenwenxiniae]
MLIKIIGSIIIPIFLAAMIGCDDDTESQLPDLGSCFSGKPAKEAKNQLGIVSYNQYENRWAIYVSVQGSYDSQIAGFYCDELDVLKHEGMKVRFSGSYLPYEKDRKPPVGSLEYYYLHVENYTIEY